MVLRCAFKISSLHQRLPKLYTEEEDFEGPKGGKNRLKLINRENRNSIWQDCIILDVTVEMKYAYLSRKSLKEFCTYKTFGKLGLKDGGPNVVQSLRGSQ